MLTHCISCCRFGMICVLEKKVFLFLLQWNRGAGPVNFNFVQLCYSGSIHQCKSQHRCFKLTLFNVVYYNSHKCHLCEDNDSLPELQFVFRFILVECPDMEPEQSIDGKMNHLSFIISNYFD